MRHRVRTLSVLAALLLGFALVPATAAATTDYQNMYRLYNPNSGEHFYTASLDEAVTVAEAGWQYEGVGWVAPALSAMPVYRLYNPNIDPSTGSGEHHYTMSEDERDMLMGEGWLYEGVGWYSDDAKSVPLYRQYNPNAYSNNHNYTASIEERDSLLSLGWDDESIAWYGVSVSVQTIRGRWITTSAWGNEGLYWIDSEAQIAKNRLIDPMSDSDADAGFLAYATSDGSVVRGVYPCGEGSVYVADGEGRLIEGTGWVETDAYTGSSQLYYIDSQTHAALIGFFEQEGKVYYGTDQGYVLRGSKLSTPSGVLLADSQGLLAENSHTAGWTVSGDYDDGQLQRYYLVDSGGHLYAKTGLFTASIDGQDSQFYGLADEGYVARGYTSSKMLIVGTNGYTADNEGRLVLVASNVSRTRDVYLANPTWTGDVTYIDELREKANSVGSSTEYCIVVEEQLCHVVVFRMESGVWVPVIMANCVGGRNHFRGTYEVVHKQICAWDDPYFGRGYNDWMTCYIEAYADSNYAGHLRYIEGKGWEDCAGFHATSDAETSFNNTGCTGLLYDDAKWIYDNVPNGTTVYIF